MLTSSTLLKLVASVVLICCVSGVHPVYGQVPQEQPVLETFTPQHRQAAELAVQLRQLLSAGGANVFVDPRANQLVVRGTSKQIALAGSVINELDRPAPGDPGLPLPSADAQTVQQPAAAQQRSLLRLVQRPENQARRLPTPARFELRTLSADELHARLEKLTGKRLPQEWDAGRQSVAFPVAMGESNGVRLWLDVARRQVQLTGAAAEVAAWAEVVQALDASPTAGKRSTGVIASNKKNEPELRRALNTIESRGEVGAKPIAAQLPDNPNADAPNPASATPGTNAAAAGGALAKASLLGPVQIEFIEGLDIIVVRGNEEDVKRVTQIINQIESLSETDVPKILVYPLKHIDSVSMGRLMQRVYEDVLGQRTGSVSITPLGRPDALLLIGRNENVQTAVDLIQQLDLPVSPTARMRAFPLQYASAADAEELINRYFESDPTASGGQDDSDGELPGGGAFSGSPLVVADTRNNTLIARAAPRDMQEIAELVKRIDRPANAQAELKVFTIKNGDAQALAEMLGSLFGTEEQDDEGGLGGTSTLTPMQITFDQRTNSVLAAGSVEDLAIVEAVLLRLDQDGLRQRETRVFRLNNAFAPEVADSLNQLLEDQREAEEAAELTISPFEQIDREIIIVAEQATNSLIISASPDQFTSIEQLVTDLDARPPMVMVQVLIAEVRLNDTDEFGLELGLQDSLLFDRSLVGDLRTIQVSEQENIGGAVVTNTQEIIVDGPLTPGFNFNDALNPLGNNGTTAALASAGAVAAQGLTNFAVGRANNALGFGGFVFSASSNSVSTLLRALQENRRLEVLSRPQVMMLDNQTGSINVGQRVPIIRGTSINQFGQQTNQFQYESVGIGLNVTPRISPDNTVVMEVRAERSAVGEEADGIPIFITPGGDAVRAPPIDQTLAQTTVSATSGQTIVLSGLLTKDTFDIHRRVPILADIPLLGDLFRYDSVQEQRTELLIIMTPRVVRGQEDADQIKQIESARMSWVIGDVVNLHGPSGLRGRDDEWTCDECEEVYPTHVPTTEEIVTPPLESTNEYSTSEATPPQPGAVTPVSHQEPAKPKRRRFFEFGFGQ